MATPEAAGVGPFTLREAARQPFLPPQKQFGATGRSTVAGAGAHALVCHLLPRIPGHVTYHVTRFPQL